MSKSMRPSRDVYKVPVRVIEHIDPIYGECIHNHCGWHPSAADPEAETRAHVIDTGHTVVLREDWWTTYEPVGD